MVWQYITFQYLLHKKGTFTYSYSNPGVGGNQKMWCCWSQIAIDYMKFCFNPLCLVYVPAPSPPPPFPPAPPLLSQTRSLITTRVHSYTWYTRVSQNNFLRQKYLAFNTWKIFSILLFSAALRPYIFATPSAKNALLFPPLNNPRIFSRFFSYYSFFHPCLTNANYLCRRIFWNLPA